MVKEFHEHPGNLWTHHEHLVFNSYQKSILALDSLSAITFNINPPAIIIATLNKIEVVVLLSLICFFHLPIRPIKIFFRI
jgi:hypothetical protein